MPRFSRTIRSLRMQRPVLRRCRTTNSLLGLPLFLAVMAGILCACHVLSCLHACPLHAKCVLATCHQLVSILACRLVACLRAVRMPSSHRHVLVPSHACCQHVVRRIVRLPPSYRLLVASLAAHLIVRLMVGMLSCVPLPCSLRPVMRSAWLVCGLLRFQQAYLRACSLPALCLPASVTT